MGSGRVMILGTNFGADGGSKVVLDSATCMSRVHEAAK